MSRAQDKTRFYNGNLFPAAGQYQLDPVHCFADFTTQHIVVGQVRGRFNSLSGAIIIADDPLLSGIQINIEAKSIDTHKAERDEDLRSERFFDVVSHPVVTYRSTRISPQPGGKWSVEGNLTIRGITRPVISDVTFNGIADDPWGNTRVAFQCLTKINRQDFGLLADLERESGGLAVFRDVRIDMAIEALTKS